VSLPRGRVVLTLLAAWATAAWPAAGQSLLDRSPNLSGGWVGAENTLHFNLVHRFNHSGPPAREVQSRPTFLLAGSGPWPVLLGVHYATRSALVAGVPNEWELFVRARALQQAAAAPADVALQVGYNAAAESLDGELSLARRFGAVRLLGAARVLSHDAHSGEVALVAAGGAVLRLHTHAAVAFDFAHRHSAQRWHRPAWSAALQLHLPTTPHTLSLQASTADATTLHAAARAAARTRWGFEFTVPFTPRRYFGRTATAASAPPADDMAVVRMHNLRYEPDTLRVRAGATVEWQNRDPLPHTATALDGRWDSGEIAPGAAWRRRFDEVGTHEIVCTPHPFMRAVVIVERAAGT
jgi:plastocyanin